MSPRPLVESPPRSHGYARQAPSDKPRADMSSERDTRDNKAIAVAVAAAMKAMDTEAELSKAQAKERCSLPSSPKRTSTATPTSPVPPLSINSPYTSRRAP